MQSRGGGGGVRGGREGPRCELAEKTKEKHRKIKLYNATRGSLLCAAKGLTVTSQPHQQQELKPEDDAGASQTGFSTGSPVPHFAWLRYLHCVVWARYVSFEFTLCCGISAPLREGCVSRVHPTNKCRPGNILRVFVRKENSTRNLRGPQKPRIGMGKENSTGNLRGPQRTERDRYGPGGRPMRFG